MFSVLFFSHRNITKMMNTIIILIIAAAATAQQFYIQDDGVPVVFGADNDRTISRPSLLISPSPSPRPVAPIQQSFRIPARPVAPIQQSFRIPARPVATIQQTLPLPPQLCNFNNLLVDEIHNGRAYHYSWCHDGHQSYTWHQASQYCTNLGNGFQSVSIEDPGEDNLISNVIAAHQIRDIWTSGNLFDSYYWSWLSGRHFQHQNWSHTGRRGLPQPDNSEQSEHCLAVLNNHYNDGIRWHDENCDRRMPVICETQQFYGN